MLPNNVCNVFYGNHLFSHYYNLFFLEEILGFELLGFQG
jgi:hypothetical protein